MTVSRVRAGMAAGLAVCALIGGLMAGTLRAAADDGSHPPVLAVPLPDEGPAEPAPDEVPAVPVPSATLEGLVTDRAGAPVAGVTVTVRALDGTETVVESDAEGRFTVTDLPPGAVAVRFVPQPGSGLAAEWHADAADPASAVRITLDEGATASIIGVLDPLVVSGTTPVVTGTARVGSTLSAKPGTWTASAILGYQWYANGRAIAGATVSTLALGGSLRGARIAVAVTGTLFDHRATTLRSAETSAIAEGVLAAPVPTITGSLAAGSTVTVKPGAWTPGTTLRYQWRADGKALAGATAQSLKIAPSQRGTRLTVTVTGTQAGYATVARTSATTARVATASTPTISGTPSTGSRLTAKPGTWTAGTTLRYQWLADGVPIAKATGTTLVLTTAQQGAAIAVRVTGSASGYATVERTSAVTARVLRVAKPSISGLFAHGSTITANPGSWTSGTSLSYQWLADGKAISGATKSTLGLSSGLRDKRISVVVTGRKSGHATVAMSSDASPRVIAAPTPTISGSAQTGRTLTVSPGAWTRGASLSMQWYADGAAVSGASGTAFAPTSAHVGKRITVRVTGRLAGYPTVSRTSAATAPVSRPAPPPAPSGGVRPVSAWDCPASAPIKGNASSKIYHTRSSRYYAATKPEVCFATEAAARAAGFRAPKN